MVGYHQRRLNKHTQCIPTHVFSRALITHCDRTSVCWSPRDPEPRQAGIGLTPESAKQDFCGGQRVWPATPYLFLTSKCLWNVHFFCPSRKKKQVLSPSELTQNLLPASEFSVSKCKKGVTGKAGST